MVSVRRKNSNMTKKMENPSKCNNKRHCKNLRSGDNLWTQWIRIMHLGLC